MRAGITFACTTLGVNCTYMNDDRMMLAQEMELGVGFGRLALLGMDYMGMSTVDSLPHIWRLVSVHPREAVRARESME